MCVAGTGALTRRVRALPIKGVLLPETSTLVDSLMGKLHNYPGLRGKLRALLMRGEQVATFPIIASSCSS